MTISTTNSVRSAGKFITIMLSEWDGPTYASSTRLPPNSMVIRSEKVTWGTAVGRFSPMIVRLALSW